MTTATDTLGASEAFTGAIQNVDLVMQFDVSDAPSGAASIYNVAIADHTPPRVGEVKGMYRNFNILFRLIQSFHHSLYNIEFSP